jgi:hypothetical protein
MRRRGCGRQGLLALGPTAKGPEALEESVGGFGRDDLLGTHDVNF